MDHKTVVQHLRKRRKTVILTMLLLLLAFFENSYLNCTRSYTFPGCELGWIYLILAFVMIAVVFHFRK
jgi:hypothetical protein